MSVTVARKRLYEAQVSLNGAWRAVEDRWQDEPARAFREAHLDELEPALRSAMGAMSRMSEVLERARTECRE
jgi:predicted metal-dependent hydrolase